MEDQKADFITYLKVIFKRKKMIGIGTFLVMIAASVGSLFLPNIYRAQATLLINPPIFQPELKPPVLSVQTYQNLLKTDYLMEKIIDELNLKDMEIEELRKGLEVELNVETKTSQSVAYSPLLHLVVKNKDPQLAADIGNTWANLFMESYRGLSSTETLDSYEFIMNQFQASRESLTDAEEKVNQSQKEFNIPLMKEQISILTKTLKNTLSILYEKELDLRVKEENLAALRSLTKAMEKENMWVGSFGSDFSEKGTTPELSLSQKSSSSIGQEISHARENLIKGRKELDEFSIKNQCNLVKMQLQGKKDQLNQYFKDLAQAQIDLKSKSLALNEISEVLEKKEKFITVSKSISDEALWDKVLQSPDQRDLKRVEGIQLKSEEISPDYLRLAQQKSSLEVETKQLQNMVPELEKRIKTVQEEIEMLEGKDYENARFLEELNHNLKVAKDTYDSLMDRYLVTKKGKNEMEIEVELLAPQVEEIKKIIRGMDEQIQELQRTTNDKELTLTRLERDVKTFQNTYKLFASKAEAAKVARAEKQKDIKIVAPAVKPEKKIEPHRVPIVLLSGIIGLMSGTFLAFVSEYWEKGEGKNK